MSPAATPPHGPAAPTAGARPGVPAPAPARRDHGQAGPPGSAGAGAARDTEAPDTAAEAPAGPGGDGGTLLDRVGRWAPAATPFGIFRLAPSPPATTSPSSPPG